MSFISRTRKYKGFRIDAVTTTSGPDFTHMVPGVFHKPKVTKRWEVYERLKNGASHIVGTGNSLRHAKMIVNQFINESEKEETK